jgi:hypothetical protein
MLVNAIEGVLDSTSNFHYVEGGSVCISKGTPVQLIANVDMVTPEHFRKAMRLLSCSARSPAAATLMVSFYRSITPPTLWKIAAIRLVPICRIATKGL